MSLPDCFVFYSSGVQTKRDHLVYASSEAGLAKKIKDFLALSDEAAAQEFNDTSMNTAAEARKLPFAKSHIKRAGYRPFDLRWHYANRRYNDRLRTEFQAVWGESNLCLYTLANGVGSGPAVWCHALTPDYHSFRGSYGGYGFPLYDHRPLGPPHNLKPSFLSGLGAAYNAAVPPEKVFDAMLCLLSARTYSALFAEDLEGAFPHVPFPRDAATFDVAASLGAEIRTLETFTRAPATAFKVAKVQTTAKGPIHASGWCKDGFTLCADGSGLITGVTSEVWNFAVSSYEILPRWLKHREGEAVDYPTMNAVLDLSARIAELLDLMGKADVILTAAIADPLTKTALNA